MHCNGNKYKCLQSQITVRLSQQVCKNNWIMRIASVKGVDKRKMKHKSEKIGTEACLVGKIGKSRMKWAGD